MRRYLFGFWVAATLLQAGCALDNSRLYDGSTQEAPQRWPAEVATCSLETDIVGQLGFVITWTQYPFIPGTIAGCGGSLPKIVFTGSSVGTPVWGGMDSTGRGVNDYNVYYEVYMDKNSHVHPDKLAKCNPSNCIVNLQRIDPNWIYHAASTPYWTSKTWTFHRPLFDRSETINGLTWRHYMFWRYESLSSDPTAPPLPVDSPQGQADDPAALTPAPVVAVSYPDALEMVGEVYEHAVDADHTMLVFANYMRPVTQDAQWFAARRTLLRKLVDAVTIRPLTPELWRTSNLQYQAQVRTQGESRWQVQMREEAQKAFEARQQAESKTSH